MSKIVREPRLFMFGTRAVCRIYTLFQPQILKTPRKYYHCTYHIVFGKPHRRTNRSIFVHSKNRFFDNSCRVSMKFIERGASNSSPNATCCQNKKMKIIIPNLYLQWVPTLNLGISHIESNRFGVERNIKHKSDVRSHLLP